MIKYNDEMGSGKKTQTYKNTSICTWEAATPMYLQANSLPLPPPKRIDRNIWETLNTISL